ncbi:MAG: RIP metalloprotease RseP [Desulfobacterales bacterium]|nr:RIP metalloprotease RseP [Desulfobacterales bacterium]
MVTAISAIVLLGVLIFVHELGHFIVAKISGVGVLKFSLGFGPKILSKKIGETEYLLSAIPLGGYVKMIGEEPGEEEKVSEDDLDKSFSHKSVLKRAGIVFAGPLFNIIFAVFVLSVIYMLGVPVLTTQIGDVVDRSPAYEAGIKKGDQIVAINGKEVSRWEDLTKIIQHSNGEELAIKLKKDDSYYETKLMPTLFTDKNIFGEDVKIYKIGISVSDKFITERYNPFMAIVKGSQQTWFLVKLMGITIIKLIERTVPANTLGGPILIIQMAGKQAQAGISNFLFFMAIISINLGIVNLFPIPILDGGHLFFFLLEAIMGKPLSVKKREAAQQVGLVIIVLLIIFVFYNDLSRIFAK